MYNKAAIFEECCLEALNTLNGLKNAMNFFEENGYMPFMLAFPRAVGAYDGVDT